MITPEWVRMGTQIGIQWCGSRSACWALPSGVQKDCSDFPVQSEPFRTRFWSQLRGLSAATTTTVLASAVHSRSFTSCSRYSTEYIFPSPLWTAKLTQIMYWCVPTGRFRPLQVQPAKSSFPTISGITNMISQSLCCCFFQSRGILHRTSLPLHPSGSPHY